MNAKVSPQRGHVLNGVDRMAMLANVRIVTVCDPEGWLVYSWGVNDENRAAIRQRGKVRQIHLGGFGWMPLGGDTHPVTTQKIYAAVADVLVGAIAYVPMPAVYEFKAYEPQAYKAQPKPIMTRRESVWRSENLQHRDYN